jgi:hypothetical protein
MAAKSSSGHLKGKRALFWSLLFPLVLVTAANIVVYLSRNKVDTFLPATYKSLYHPTDIPTLSGTRIIRQGQLMLKFAMKYAAQGWIIVDDTGDRYEQTGKYPVLKLRDFIHNYDLETRGITPPARISVRFGFYSREFYKKGGRTQPDNYWLISASVPMGIFRQRPLSYWIDSFPYVDEREKEEGRRILREDMNVSGGEGTLEKIEKICAYQYALYKKQAGIPDDQMKVEVSPLKIFLRFRAGKGQIWCTQMALIYHFFANLAGVPTRLITLEGHIDKTITTGHSFAESFIPERGSWARVDPSANKFYVWNRENKLLNSADILHVVLTGSFSDLSAKTLKDGAVVTVPYGEVNASDIQLFSPGAHLIFRRGNYASDTGLARYLFTPNLGYSLDADYTNGVYLLRRLLFVTWAALLIGCLVSLGSYLRSRSEKAS